MSGPEAMRTVVVTGCAKGIGHAIADRLSRDGYRVVGVDRDHAPL
jgi:NAD(P)-dependent dehydrogenase (short-subunit alcohol dehydrogenase family)